MIWRGAFVDDAAGPIAAQWESVIGAGAVSVDLGPDDVDASGCLWLRLSVDVTDFGAGKIPEWKINDLAVSLDVQMEDEAEPQR